MMSETTSANVIVNLDSWAGRTLHLVEIVKETPKRFLVIWRDDTCFRGKFVKGEKYYIPKYAITRDLKKKERYDREHGFPSKELSC